jgi:hypothetical protein
MTMTNAEWMIKNGHKFSELDVKCLGLERGCEITINGKTVEKVPLVNMVSAIICWLDEEHKEPILDDAEREYLSAVIRPFRDDVKFIVKYNGCFSSMAYEEIAVWYRNKMRGDAYHSFVLPSFEKGTMYKGVEVNRHYTLEELGL